MSVAWVLGSLCAAGGLAGSFLVGFANGVADAPSADNQSNPWVPLAFGVGVGAVIIGSHYVKGLHW